MAAATLPGDGGWIVTTSLDKPDPKTRRLIRSHVMRGKNTREDRKQRKQNRKKASGSDTSLDSPNEDPEWFLTSPRKVATEISTFGYGFDMHPYMEELVYRAFTLIKPSTFSIEHTLIGRKQDDFFCFANLSQSPAMLHSVLFSTQAFRDMSLRVPPGDVARWHQTQTLFHLQRMLTDEKMALETSTMAVVASLATAAVFGGDFETAQKHVDGLWRMIDLKGGFDVVGRGGMVEHKAQRLDFGLALSTGKTVRYRPEKQSWSPFIAFDNARKFPELDMLQPRPEPRLLNTWADVRQFSLAANQATSTDIKLPPSLMKQLATSVPWRLTNLEYDLHTESQQELLRLCMLAFVKSMLVSMKGLGRGMKYLVNRMQTALLAQRDADDESMNKFLFWACFVAQVAIFEDMDQLWLLGMLIETSTALDLSTWEQARAVLKTYPWIDVIYDAPSETIFNDYLSPQPIPS